MPLFRKLQHFALSFAFLFALASPSGSFAADNPHRRQQNSAGLTWAMQAIAALTGGNPINAANESGSVQIIDGNNQDMGTVTLQSTGVMDSQVAITTSIGTRTETRSISNQRTNGTWIDINGVPHDMPLHNCWTDAVWFFPALSLLADYADPNLVFTDIGPEQYQGSSVEHIQVYRTRSGLGSYRAQLLARLSTVDFYLDSQTAIPLAIAFVTHADTDLNVNIAVAFAFSNYQVVNGILVPFQINKSFNGSPTAQISLSSATLNGPVNKPLR